jgi:hypothetical protein
LFWKNDINIEVLGYIEYHIDAKVSIGGDIDWRLAYFYEEARTSARYRTWDLMKLLVTTIRLAWLCVGDFNEVLRTDVHVSIGQRRASQIVGFRDAVDVCGLMDLGYQGRS